MRFLALLPLLCVCVAFVLSMLCLFAGSRTGFMEDFDLLTLNVSRIGHISLNSSSLNTNGSQVLDNLHNEFQNLQTDVQNEIQQGVNSAVDRVTEVLDIHDFYSAHLLDYCEGYYEPSPIANATSQPWKNITRCSNSTALFAFQPSEIIQSELKPGISLQDLKFPDEVKNAVATIEVASKAMSILYIIGIGLTGLAVIGAAIGFFGNGRLAAICNFILDFFAFAALGIASAIATALIVNIVDAVNKYGNDIGIAATKGKNFLILSWVATALVAIAAIGWIVDCCCGGGRRKRSYTGKMG